MHLQVLTPNKEIFSEEIDELIVNTLDGEIGILPNHIQLVTRIKPCEMIIKIKEKKHYFAITGGFLEVDKNKLTIIADYAVRSEDIVTEEVLQAKKRAEEILKKTKESISERDFAIAQSDLERAVLQLNIANRRRKERPTIPQK
jgi:F-type H+-transporting ATPase subunit epsilon